MQKNVRSRTGWNSTVTHRVHVCVTTLASGPTKSITLLKLPEALDCIPMTELGTLTGHVQRQSFNKDVMT